MKIPVPESFQLHDKFIPVPDYVIPKTRSRDESNSRTIKRETIQDIIREIPAYVDPIFRPLPNQLKYPYKKFVESMDLETDINTVFEENSPYKEGVISEMYQRPDRSAFQEPPELDSADKIITLYNSSLFAGHQCVIKCI